MSPPNRPAPSPAPAVASLDALDAFAPDVPARLRVERVVEIDSTNDELLRRDPLFAGTGPAAGTDPVAAVWLVADRQTRGRGRRQRAWQSTVAGSLTASFGREVVQPRELGALPLVAGVALAEALAGFGVDVRLKWPNDLYLVDRASVSGFAKVGGILCEARARGGVTRVVIGCGLNLLAPAAAASIDQPVAGLFDAVPPPSRERLIDRLGAALLAATDQHFEDGFAAFRERFAARDLLAGAPVTVLRDGQSRDAVACGLAADGALLVRFDDRNNRNKPNAEAGAPERLLAEEVSIRPRR